MQRKTSYPVSSVVSVKRPWYEQIGLARTRTRRKHLEGLGFEKAIFTLSTARATFLSFFDESWASGRV